MLKKNKAAKLIAKSSSQICNKVCSRGACERGLEKTAGMAKDSIRRDQCDEQLRGRCTYAQRSKHFSERPAVEIGHMLRPPAHANHKLA